jgi:hexosaminidase
VHPLLLLFISVFIVFFSFASAANDINKPNENCLTLMPCPKKLNTGEGVFILKSSPTLFIKGMNKNRQQAALKRISGQLKKVPDYNFIGFTLVDNSDSADVNIVIKADSKHVQRSNLPMLGNNESYQLNITKKAIIIKAVTDFGALHALTSLVQIVAMSGNELNTEPKT